MDRVMIVDERALAQMVKNAGRCATGDCDASIECPKCQKRITNKDVPGELSGLPKGVKFDPSGPELLGHLAAKCGKRNTNGSIDGYIEMLDEGMMNYTHPENLPGATKDGRSFYVFYKVSNAHGKGKRKLRRIENHENSVAANVRWHKTGNTKAVTEKGMHLGYRKILVLYSVTTARAKPVKQNWIMHQYHLGNDKEEKNGELVVSKIFYQAQNKESKEIEADNLVPPADQDVENHHELSHEESGDQEFTRYFTDESQNLDSTETNVLYNETSTAYDFGPSYAHQGDGITSSSGDAENSELYAQPEFQLNNSQFADGFINWENQG